MNAEYKVILEKTIWTFVEAFIGALTVAPLVSRRQGIHRPRGAGTGARGRSPAQAHRAGARRPGRHARGPVCGGQLWLPRAQAASHSGPGHARQRGLGPPAGQAGLQGGRAAARLRLPEGALSGPGLLRPPGARMAGTENALGSALLNPGGPARQNST